QETAGLGCWRCRRSRARRCARPGGVQQSQGSAMTRAGPRPATRETVGPVDALEDIAGAVPEARDAIEVIAEVRQGIKNQGSAIEGVPPGIQRCRINERD